MEKIMNKDTEIRLCPTCNTMKIFKGKKCARCRKDVDTEIIKRFEANMLDGDSIDNCGGAMISAKESLDWLLSEVKRAKKETLEETIEMLWKLHKDERNTIHEAYNESLDLAIFKLKKKVEGE